MLRTGTDDPEDLRASTAQHPQFLKMLERNIFNEETDHDFERDSSEFNNRAMIQQDDYRLKNLARMVSQAPSASVARMWEVKLAELLSNVKWRSLSNRAHGYEFKGGTA